MSSTSKLNSAKCLFISLALLFAAEFASAADAKVNISGKVFFIHQVVQGETLYSLARTYSTTVDVIVGHNPSLKDGLKSGQMIKIPAFCDGQNETKRSKREFTAYVVRKGDTLYSISREFSVSIDALLDDNPTVDPTRLAIGTKLFVRKSAMGHTSDSEAMSQLRAEGERMSSVESSAVEYHVVEKGETATSLAKNRNVDPQAILDMNGNDAAQLTEGALIKLPVVADVISEANVAKNKKIGVLEIGEVANVSLLLPFTRNGQVSSPIIDFYKGFLLGLDRCRENGYKIDLHVFDSCRDTVRVKELVDRGSFSGTNLIIGPVYENCLSTVIPYAEQNGIPVVSPLAAIQNVSSEVLFQMAPDPSSKYVKLKDLFALERRVVFISTKSNDAAFVNEMKALAGKRPIEYREYAYENPNIIEKRERLRASGVSVAESKGDLTPLLHCNGPMTIVVVSDNETDVDRVVSAITSARASLIDRSMDAADVTIVGSSKWTKYSNIDRAIFFRGDVTFISSYIANGTSIAEKKFNRTYIGQFGSVPTLFSCRGYDAAVIFISSLYGPIGSALEGKRFIPVEVPYEFSRGKDGVVRNTEWVRVIYNGDYTLMVE